MATANSFSVIGTIAAILIPLYKHKFNKAENTMLILNLFLIIFTVIWLNDMESEFNLYYNALLNIILYAFNS